MKGGTVEEDPTGAGVDNNGVVLVEVRTLVTQIHGHAFDATEQHDPRTASVAAA
jgi:hypothetical protein